MTSWLPCPACGFLVFAETYGTYDICQVCNWEDDPVQLGNPCRSGGANVESLADCQAKLLVRLPTTVLEHAGHQRASDWRPLSRAEILECQRAGASQQTHLTPVTDPTEAYWRRGRA